MNVHLFCFDFFVCSYRFRGMNAACRLHTEFAPFQRVPKPSRRRDPRAGTIDKGSTRMCTVDACTCPPNLLRHIYSPSGPS